MKSDEVKDNLEESRGVVDGDHENHKSKYNFCTPKETKETFCKMPEELRDRSEDRMESYVTLEKLHEVLNDELDRLIESIWEENDKVQKKHNSHKRKIHGITGELKEHEQSIGEAFTSIVILHNENDKIEKQIEHLETKLQDIDAFTLGACMKLELTKERLGEVEILVGKLTDEVNKLTELVLGEQKVIARVLKVVEAHLGSGTTRA